MALIAFLKGVNVGGHRRLRPTVLASELREFDVVNIGAAGTLVVRKAISPANLRAEIACRTPFDVDIMVCSENEILRLLSSDPFAGRAFGREVIPFVSVMSERRRLPSGPPLDLPTDGDWRLRVLACQDRFVVGLHYREMKAIAYLGQLEKLLGVSLTTRNWNTFVTIGKILRS